MDKHVLKKYEMLNYLEMIKSEKYIEEKDVLKKKTSGLL